MDTKTDGRGRTRKTPIPRLGLYGPTKLYIWSEANEYISDTPPKRLTQLMKASTSWNGIATDWIVVNDHNRIQSTTAFDNFWKFAQTKLKKNRMNLVPGVKIHGFIPGKLSPKSVLAAMKTGNWAKALFEYGDRLYEQYGMQEIATDWEYFNKTISQVKIPGDDFVKLGETFQGTVERPWKFVHWFPGLLTVRFDYLEADRSPSWVGAYNRFNIARYVFCTPLTALLTGDSYWAKQTWYQTTEIRYNRSVERRRSLNSLGIVNAIPGFTCSSKRTLNNGVLIFKYLMPDEILAMPTWKSAETAFLFIARNQFATSGQAMRRALYAVSSRQT